MELTFQILKNDSDFLRNKIYESPSRLQKMERNRNIIGQSEFEDWDLADADKTNKKRITDLLVRQNELVTTIREKGISEIQKRQQSQQQLLDKFQRYKSQVQHEKQDQIRRQNVRSSTKTKLTNIIQEDL